MRKLSLKFSRQERMQWTLVALVLAIAGAVGAYLVYHERELALLRESERLLTQARVIDENLSRQLVGANAALASVRDDMPILFAAGLRTHGSRRLLALTDAMPGVRTMLVTDAHGNVIASNRQDALGVNVSKRPYFRNLGNLGNLGASPPDDLVYVSEPFDTMFKVFSINLVKTWSNEQAAFAGIVTATLDPTYFQVLLRSVLYADDMRCTVIHGNGKAFLSVPATAANKAIEGLDLAVPGSFLSQHRAAGSNENLLTGRVSVTGDERMVAYRTIRPSALRMDLPLYVAVSRELQAVLAPWRQLAGLYALMYGVFASLLVTGLLLLQREQRALMALTRVREQELREHAEQVDLALAGADLGLWDMEVKTGRRTVNPRAQEMIGDGPDDPVDDVPAWSARLHPEDKVLADQALRLHELGGADAFAADYRVRHKNGEWVWIHSRGKVTQRGPDGTPERLTGTYLDISDRKAAEARISEFAFYDPLTQLPNRRLLMDRLAQAQHASGRSRRPAALMFLDLDRFKWVNDALGHDMGDLLLQQVALRLETCVRQSDTVARLGGDEFVLVIQHLGDSAEDAAAHARKLADKVLAALRQNVALGDVQHSVTTSIGIALFCGEDEPASQLLKRADQAMYQAKAAGRNLAHIDAEMRLPAIAVPTRVL